MCVCVCNEVHLCLDTIIQNIEQQKNEALNLVRIEHAHAEELAICLKAARGEIAFLKQQTHAGPVAVREGIQHSRKSLRRLVTR